MSNNNDCLFQTFQILRLIRELLSNIRFYTAHIPEKILPNDEWDKMRKDFSEIDELMSKAQDKIVNEKDNENGERENA